MKRLTSIFLVIAMLLAIAPMNIFAAEAENTVFSDMKETDYYAQAATALEQLDILAGYPDGTFGAEKSITRAEMAAIVCRMIDKEADSEKAKGETIFDDVYSDHWASGYINIASKEGIINGDGNGKFRPEDDVKHEEAIKMVVCALGYGDDVEVDAKDWSKGYLEVADEKGISNDLKGTKGKASTRGDVAVMTYNGLATDTENSKIPATPVASVKAGEYNGTQKVKLTTTTKDADIFYTTDGTTPTVKSTKYTKEISISKTSTLKAIAVKNGVVSKSIMSVAYTIKKVSSGGGGGGSYTPPATTYTVSFDLNYEGATGALASQSIREGNKATEPNVPIRDGFVFVGWTENTETNEVFDFSTEITKNFTLYAVWTTGYLVSFDLNYENAIGAPISQNINAGGKAVLPTEPVRDGFTFAGWATSPTGETMWNFAHFVTESMTLYAIWATTADVSLDTPDADVEIYSFNTDVYDILVGTTEEVTFTSEIFANVELSDTDVSVVDETGTILGYMNDEGSNGDETADDGVYTLKKTFNADERKNTQYNVVAKNITSDNVINICYYKQFSEEELEDADSIILIIDEIVEPYLNVNNSIELEDVEEIISRICTYLDDQKAQEKIISYHKETDSSIFIEFKSGYPFVYELSIDGLSNGGSDLYVASYAPYDGTRGDLETLYDEALDGTSNNIKNTFDSYKFNSDSDYNLDEVTLDALKNLSNYQIVLWGGHGGYDNSVNGTGSRLRTGEIYNTETSEKYSKDIDAGRVIDTGSAGGRRTYAVTGGFFEKYLGNMDNALVYLSACHSGQDMIDGIRHKYQLAQSFINKGAKAVVGNSESILSVYTYEMERDILNRMCVKSNDEYYTLSEALDYAKSLNGQNDGTSRNARPIIFPQNDQNALNYRLEETATGSISGKVMSADSSTDISNALVRIYQNNNLIKSIRTDSQGNYTADLPAGDYIVKITAGNYKSAKMAVVVVQDTVTYNETFLLVQIGDEIGYANGTITNALNAQAVSNVSVKVRSGWNNQTGSVVYTTTTNDAGYYEIEHTPGLYTIEFSKDGFITGYKNIVVGALGLFAQNAVISPIMSDVEGEYRFILSWRDRPDDLDSHLTGPLENSEDRFHLFYPLKDTNCESANPYREFATLDWDNTRINQNSDPETVTLHKQIDGVYRYSVHDYSNGGNASSTDMASSNAKVDVYKGSMLIGTYHVPNVAGTIWTVFELSGDIFTPVNRVGNGYANDINLFSLREEDSSVENELLYDENIIVSDIEEKE